MYRIVRKLDSRQEAHGISGAAHTKARVEAMHDGGPIRWWEEETRRCDASARKTCHVTATRGFDARALCQLRSLRSRLLTSIRCIHCF